jgi:putative transposase
VKVKLHRPIEGQIKTIAFKREANGWYVVFSCDLGDVAILPSSGRAIGIDLGLKAFLVTLEGERVDPPQHYRYTQAALRRAQRKVARRRKDSKRRAKAVHAQQNSISGSAICGVTSTTKRLVRS